MPGFVYQNRTDQIRSEPIPQLIFGLIYLLILTRFIWPLQLPLSIKIVGALLALVALQFHRLSKLSSGSVFSPEFPRPVVVIFNWALGTIVLVVSSGASASTHGAPATWVGILKIVLGVLLVLLAVKQWRGRPRGDADPELPGWMCFRRGEPQGQGPAPPWSALRLGCARGGAGVLRARSASERLPRPMHSLALRAPNEARAQPERKRL